MRRAWTRPKRNPIRQNVKKWIRRKVKNVANEEFRKVLETSLDAGQQYMTSRKKGKDTWRTLAGKGSQDQIVGLDLALQRRGPGGRTYTKSRNRGRTNVRARAAGSTFTSFKTTHKYPLGYPKLVNRFTAPQRWLTNVELKSANTISGKQAYIGLTAMTRGQLQSLQANMTLSNWSSWYLTGCRVETLLTNYTTTNVFVRIYEVRNRSASDYGLETTMSGAFAQGGSLIDGFIVGLKPFDNTTFCKEWKVLHSYELELAEGRTHKHTSTYMVHKHIQKDVLNDETLANIPKITHGLLIIHYGAPGLVTTNTNDVTFSQDTLAVISTRKYYYRYVQPLTGQMVGTNSLTQTSSPVTIIDQASGNVEVVVEG